MRFIHRVSFYILLLSLPVLSCSKSDDEDCGCGGSTRRMLENQQARYVGEGIFIVADTLGDYMEVQACDVDISWKKSNDEKTWNYSISGNIKNTCLGPNPELRLPPPGGPIQITNIKTM